MNCHEWSYSRIDLRMFGLLLLSAISLSPYKLWSAACGEVRANTVFLCNAANNTICQGYLCRESTTVFPAAFKPVFLILTVNPLHAGVDL